MNSDLKNRDAPMVRALSALSKIYELSKHPVILIANNVLFTKF